MRSRVLGLLTKLSSLILGGLGVITSSCGSAPCDYGTPPVLYIEGNVSGAEGPIEGIRLTLESPDSSQIYFQRLSDSEGNYFLALEDEQYPWPDSLVVRAVDVDGPENGAYLPDDTLLTPDPETVYQEFPDIDFDLDPEGK